MRPGIVARPHILVVGGNWNPADKYSGITLSNANETATLTSGAGGVRSVALLTGKHYFEFLGRTPSFGTFQLGIVEAAQGVANDPSLGGYGWVIGWNSVRTETRHNNTFVQVDATPITTGSIGMVAVDMAAGKVWFGRNGTWYSSGNPAAGTSPIFSGITGNYKAFCYMNEQNAPITSKFQQAAWTYAAPAGFGPIP